MCFRYTTTSEEVISAEYQQIRGKSSVTATDDKRDDDIIIKIIKPKRDCFLTRVAPK